MHRRAHVWITLAALAVGATLAATVTAAHHEPAPVREMCALLTQPHTPVPDQRCDTPGVGRWRLVLD